MADEIEEVLPPTAECVVGWARKVVTAIDTDRFRWSIGPDVLEATSMRKQILTTQ
jgi:hypothetical protein